MYPTLSHIFTTHSEKFLTSKKVKDAFEKLFLDNPNTWMTAEKVKKKLEGYNMDLGDSFSSVFLEFRDNFLPPDEGYKICKFKMPELTSKFLYSYTNLKGIHINHDQQLDKEIRKKQKRKIRA